MPNFLITAATSVNPIVITTSVAHGFTNAQSVVISSCFGNWFANGTWTIGLLTSTTFNLSTSIGSLTVTGASNTTPIVISTSTAHRLTTGKTVTVAGIVGTTNANVVGRTVTYVSSTSFSLDSTVGNAPYISGGLVTSAYVGSGIATRTSYDVTAATNATPIAITTSAVHGLTTGTRVIVAAVGGNTAANGTWAITVTSTTAFTLVGSVGSGNYTSGGTVTVTSPFQLVSEANLLNTLNAPGLTYKGYSSSFTTTNLINDFSVIENVYRGYQASWSASDLLNQASIYDDQYQGFSSTWGQSSISEVVRAIDTVDFDSVKGHPKTQSIYYKLKGYNADTQEFESWVVYEDITPRPVLFQEGDHPPNHTSGIYYSPPSGNDLTDISIVARWIV